MKEKQGFTLIELLAVIVILAVIALIATPLIMGTISKAKMNSLKDSAYGILKAAENYRSEKLMDTQGDIKSFVLKNLESETTLLYKGKKPKCGYLIVDNGVEIIVVSDGQYVARKNSYDKDITTTKGTCKELETEMKDIENPVQDGLQLYLDGTISPVLENGKMVWKDKSSNHYDGVLENFESIQTAWVNQGIQFQKEGMTIFLPTNLNVFPTSSYTIEAYVKEDSFPPTDITYHKFLIKRKNTDGNPYLFIGSRNKQWYGAPGSTDVLFSQKIVDINNKHLLTMTYDSNTKKTILYLDGVKVSESTNEITPFVERWTIGATQDYKEGIDGTIHAVRMYQKTLTPNEVYKNYVADLSKY